MSYDVSFYGFLSFGLFCADRVGSEPYKMG